MTEGLSIIVMKYTEQKRLKFEIVHSSYYGFKNNFRIILHTYILSSFKMYYSINKYSSFPLWSRHSGAIVTDDS